MFSPVLFRFSKPNSCLFLLFFLSHFHLLPCALSQREAICDTLFRCGNLTAGFPFWGAARPEACGHPSLVLHCHQNKTALIISGQMYQILQIDNSSNTLRLARQAFFNETFCSSIFTDTTLTPKLFELLPDYKTLFVYYLCNSRFHSPANFSCPNIGVASVHQDNSYQEHCDASFNITVPTSYNPEEDGVNLDHLGSVLRNGFTIKLKIDERPCQECQFNGGICAYHAETPVCCKTNSSEPRCNPMIPSGSIVDELHSRRELSKKAKIGIGFSCGFLGATLITGCLLCFIILKRRTSPHPRPRDHNLKALVQLKQYSYAEVRKITKLFSHTVGKGGFGTVYGGNLCDGRKVAVKILKDFKSNGEDFINEVASMSQTSHVNIVSLLGFCYEGSKRAIVYQFLENGSLDQFLSKKKSLNLDVSTLYRIALGVARGLDYLHHGCKTRIVHFDIKPQNILLDENLCAKVSDFGLAKLCEKRESMMSSLDARGTIGYIAPEVFSRMYGRVSHKSDVYSYGMLVLEMIGAKNKEIAETAASNASSTYFPDWIYHDLEDGEHIWITGDGITREESNIAKKMILVGLWCIQPYPSQRPLMDKVIEMMEGSLDALEVPPKPYMQNSITPLPESSWFSEENSNNSELQVEKLFSA
ncbi:Wall-associated receptor kinase C-terminal [Arabidopsis thaliana x Arabidopsis arenosa]|uniref:non-specific serine/threonine protein kinase n=1 Tax=Arabidopsis thaliana x Arabidopsis arenosa TaxID=1240361 RepID=A0A8T1YCT8_9BRAS|nr:Wall-associated receptor kinase C-terminal [Arabidopsis thaliana x Arabidopsis arenosa]